MALTSIPRNIALAVDPAIMPTVEKALSGVGIHLGTLQGGRQRLRVYRAGCPVTPSTGDPLAADRLGLSTRQLRILELIANGDQFEDIAHVIHLSADRVKHEASDLYRLLGAQDRAHAVAIGFRSGILGGAA